jgi:hypothetical protein
MQTSGSGAATPERYGARTRPSLKYPFGAAAWPHIKTSSKRPDAATDANAVNVAVRDFSQNSCRIFRKTPTFRRTKVFFSR